jgi:hypothetical protein
MNEKETDGERRLERLTKPKKCPACGHGPVASVLYGLPSFSAELDEEVQAGRIVLGGCCVSKDDPMWTCSKCGAAIYRRKR